MAVPDRSGPSSGLPEMPATYAELAAQTADTTHADLGTHPRRRLSNLALRARPGGVRLDAVHHADTRASVPK
jgi:hypothetical protein